MTIQKLSVRVKRERANYVDRCYGNNFYKGIFAPNQDVEDYNFTVIKKNDSNVNTIEPKSFWLVFNDPFLNRSIWKNVHREFVPFQKYENIHSMKWIFRNGSMQLLIDKVKRDEYLSDLLFISNHLDQFKLINDLKFYSIFNQKYKRYLLSPQMELINQFLDSILNNNSSSNNNNNNNSNNNNNNKSIDHKTNNNITSSIFSNIYNWFWSDDNSLDLNEMSKDQLLEHYKGLKPGIENFIKALESKHFELGKYVLDEWLVNQKMKLDWNFLDYPILIGNKEILEYFCNISKDNMYGIINLGLDNIYHRDDFEECMKLLEDSGNISKGERRRHYLPHYMHTFKTKRNLIYFLNNGYQCNEKIFRFISSGTMEQLCCVPMILRANDSLDLRYLYSSPKIFLRQHILFQQFNLSLDELTDQFPLVAEKYKEYLIHYDLVYNANYMRLLDSTNLPLPNSTVGFESIGQHGNMQNIKDLIETFYSSLLVKDINSQETQTDNHHNSQLLIMGAASRNHLHVLQMIFNDYPLLRENFLTDQDLSNNLLKRAIDFENLEMLDYLLDQLKIECPPSSLLSGLCNDSSVILSYFLCKLGKNNTPYLESKDFQSFVSKKKSGSSLKIYKM
ncbi:hypothetical protein CYY_004425 [Polysphondylium violaceum]|uniref:Uncharacterized protein n=1 Tax=Polysphondylium violaceum TaxID=133409 RepID=A0A8J4UT08_9MYCE|nr:hypothetical protein CYY_004425 [Polysphondylium violaceum]